MNSQLYILERYDPQIPDKREPRLEFFATNEDACTEVVKWAGDKSCFCAQIDESLAKKIYPKIPIIKK